MPLKGFKSKRFGMGQMFESAPVRDGWRLAATEHVRGDGQMEFIDQPRAEQGIIQFAAAFAEQPPHLPLLPQPTERRAEIDLFSAADLHRVRHGAQLLEPVCGGATGGENNDGREPLLEYLRPGIDGTGAADDHTQVIFRQTALEPLPPERCRAGTEVDGRGIDRAGARHYRVGSCAQFEQVFVVAGAGERRYGPIGRRNFPIRRHRHIHQHERPFRLFRFRL